MAKPEIGQAAPAAAVLGTDAQVFSLKSYAGKNLVLYFYPKDATPG